MADDASDFARSMSIATSGLRAQAGRMRVISENIANADSTAPTAGGDPYRRKVPTFSSALDRTLDARVVTLGTDHHVDGLLEEDRSSRRPLLDTSGSWPRSEKDDVLILRRRCRGVCTKQGYRQYEHAPHRPPPSVT